jgi:hypothetical protein
MPAAIQAQIQRKIDAMSLRLATFAVKYIATEYDRTLLLRNAALRWLLPLNDQPWPE